MQLHINGDVVNVPSTVASIRDLIQYFEIDNPVVIVEHNHKILEKEDHANTTISEGDTIELVQFVGGG
ncbi:MAG TPA: sulfur carrier protein ThiS [Bacillota bacterium]|nr:sulfur carrier protein ThiS [Bacillota bacterium]